MWMSKEEVRGFQIDLKNSQDKILRLEAELADCKKELVEFKDETGEALIERLTRLAKMAKIDVYSKEYQDIMQRVFMDIGGRQSAVLKGYSQTAFMKDNPQEILERVQEFQRQMSVVTKQLEDQSKSKKK